MKNWELAEKRLHNREKLRKKTVSFLKKSQEGFNLNSIFQKTNLIFASVRVGQ